MKQTDIEINLNSRGGIDKAIRQLEKYKQRINAKLLELIDVMCMDGEEYAVQYLTDGFNAAGFDYVDTGNTLESIAGYREGKNGIITAGGAVWWIEFGTGTTYNQGGDPYHPNRSELGVVPWGTYGQGRGNARTHPYGWFFYNEESGKAGITQGLPENPFLALTAQRLKAEFQKTAQKVFSK